MKISKKQTILNALKLDVAPDENSLARDLISVAGYSVSLSELLDLFSFKETNGDIAVVMLFPNPDTGSPDKQVAISGIWQIAEKSWTNIYIKKLSNARY